MGGLFRNFSDQPNGPLAFRRRRASRGYPSVRPARDLHVLARPDLPRNLLLEESRHCRHDQYESGRRSDRTVHPEIWIWRGERLELARRPACAGAAQSGYTERKRRRVYHRWSARPSLRRETRSGAACVQVGSRHPVLSHFHEAKNSTPELGRIPDPASIHDGNRPESTTNLGPSQRHRRATPRFARTNAEGIGSIANSGRCMVCLELRQLNYGDVDRIATGIPAQAWLE